jgi:hypothetical protein
MKARVAQNNQSSPSLYDTLTLSQRYQHQHQPLAPSSTGITGGGGLAASSTSMGTPVSGVPVMAIPSIQQPSLHSSTRLPPQHSHIQSHGSAASSVLPPAHQYSITSASASASPSPSVVGVQPPLTAYAAWGIPSNVSTMATQGGVATVASPNDPLTRSSPIMDTMGMATIWDAQLAEVDREWLMRTNQFHQLEREQQRLRQSMRAGVSNISTSGGRSSGTTVTQLARSHKLRGSPSKSRSSIVRTSSGTIAMGRRVHDDDGNVIWDSPQSQHRARHQHADYHHNESYDDDGNIIHAATDGSSSTGDGVALSPPRPPRRVMDANQRKHNSRTPRMSRTPAYDHFDDTSRHKHRPRTSRSHGQRDDDYSNDNYDTQRRDNQKRATTAHAEATRPHNDNVGTGNSSRDDNKRQDRKRPPHDDHVNIASPSLIAQRHESTPSLQSRDDDIPVKVKVVPQATSSSIMTPINQVNLATQNQADAATAALAHRNKQIEEDAVAAASALTKKNRLQAAADEAASLEAERKRRQQQQADDDAVAEAERLVSLKRQQLIDDEIAENQRKAKKRADEDAAILAAKSLALKVEADRVAAENERTAADVAARNEAKRLEAIRVAEAEAEAKAKREREAVEDAAELERQRQAKMRADAEAAEAARLQAQRERQAIIDAAIEAEAQKKREAQEKADRDSIAAQEQEWELAAKKQRDDDDAEAERERRRLEREERRARARQKDDDNDVTTSGGGGSGGSLWGSTSTGSRREREREREAADIEAREAAEREGSLITNDTHQPNTFAANSSQCRSSISFGSKHS